MLSIEFRRENKVLPWLQKHGYKIRSREMHKHSIDITAVNKEKGIVIVCSGDNHHSIRGYSWEEIKQRGLHNYAKNHDR